MNATDHTDDETQTLADFLTAHGWQLVGDGRRWEKGGVTMTGSQAQAEEWANWNDETNTNQRD